MRFRRVSEHVKDQNWFAVVLDFLIVVAGILIAFQITNWNEARRDRFVGNGTRKSWKPPCALMTLCAPIHPKRSMRRGGLSATAGLPAPNGRSHRRRRSTRNFRMLAIWTSSPADRCNADCATIMKTLPARLKYR